MKRVFQGRTALFAGVGVAAIGIAVALILVSVLGNSGGKKTAPPPTTTAVTTRAADTGTMTTTPAQTTAPAKTIVPGGTEAAALFAGIPQKLNALGRQSAPYTLVEFADPQCPFCRQFTLDALPTVVKDYVRPGKLKIVYFGIDILGPDSTSALEAVYAAGLQDKLWDYVDLLYRNQGEENTGWVTDGILRAVANSIHGIRSSKLMAARTTSEVRAALQIAAQQAGTAKVNSTPTFFIGKSGQTLEHLNVTALTAGEFTSLLDPIVQ